MFDFDPFEEFGRLTEAGPLTRSLAERRTLFIEGFLCGQPMDREEVHTAATVHEADGVERVTAIPRDRLDEAIAPAMFTLFPTATVPAEVDSLAILRSARDEGYTSPLLAVYEAQFSPAEVG